MERRSNGEMACHFITSWPILFLMVADTACGDRRIGARYIMGAFLIIFAWLCYAIFIARILWRVLLLSKVQADTPRDVIPSRGTGILTAVRMVRDIVFLTRLFRANPLLWIGEWSFHAAFVLVLVRHLRYLLSSAPEWLMRFEFAGMLAGYILPASLLFVLTVKLLVEKKKYFSTGNFVLLSLLLLLSATGILMKDFVHPDIIGIKDFISNALRFEFVQAPESPLFTIHFVTAFIFLSYLPTHIFAAPFTIMDAREREDTIHQVIHEK